MPVLWRQRSVMSAQAWLQRHTQLGLRLLWRQQQWLLTVKADSGLSASAAGVVAVMRGGGLSAIGTGVVVVMVDSGSSAIAAGVVVVMADSGLSASAAGMAVAATHPTPLSMVTGARKQHNARGSGAQKRTVQRTVHCQVASAAPLEV